ncbi:SRPBCC family protein [Devosia nitrariae]|uniref:ATPase n=1 Tax=Devosia nitrariae TaxID=2071872 RepID=A0ABQ5W3T0_9HYPH|nr:SRPBCC domain-containing protein [Devosia nitrariae]GLQ54642.1 ATPase [Devosia nitrariae]
MTPTALSMTRVIRAPRERVFAAWTDPESLKKWWGPGPVVCPEAHVDLREGGAYRIANRHPDGSVTWISGVFERVVQPEQLVYTWSVSTYPGNPTLVTLDFNQHPEGTELVLNHERFTDAATRDMHMAGWEGCLVKLEALFV